MNPVDPTDPIETALGRLRPAPLEPALMARLSAARPQRETNHSSDAEPAASPPWHNLLMRWLLPATTGLCTAIAAFWWLDRHHAQPPTPAQTQRPSRHSPVVVHNPASKRGPIQSEDYLVRVRPVGVMVAPNQKPYRIIDVQWVEYETAPPDENGTTSRTPTLRRDVVPVALEFY